MERIFSFLEIYIEGKKKKSLKLDDKPLSFCETYSNGYRVGYCEALSDDRVYKTSLDLTDPKVFKSYFSLKD